MLKPLESALEFATAAAEKVEGLLAGRAHQLEPFAAGTTPDQWDEEDQALAYNDESEDEDEDEMLMAMVKKNKGKANRPKGRH